MNRQMASLLCLAVLFVALPACRKKREEKKQQEEINTMIDMNDVVEEEVEAKKSIIKF